MNDSLNHSVTFDRTPLRIDSPQSLLLSVVALLLVIAGGSSELSADGPNSNVVLNSVTDGFRIHMTYFPAYAKEGNQSNKNALGSPDAGVVILLHGKGGDRLVWDKKSGDSQLSFIDGLRNELGFAVVTVDLRKHGESKSPDGAQDDAILRVEDYDNMWRGDLEAVKQFLMDEHQDKKLNVNKLGIIAADDMAPVAAQFAVFDWSKPPFDDAPANQPQARTRRGQDVRALVLLSPSANAGRSRLMAAAKTLRDPKAGIAMLIIVGDGDELDRGVSKSVYQLVSAMDREHERTYLQSYKQVKFRGTDLLNNVDTLNVMAQFLNKHVQQLDSPWEDRRSRLER
ncbi:MAG: hypothetical protein KDA93_22480 [Planctomycetaceae bacterium]|nr:hypothetical protein [Planctomycetaceae bacterium]